MSLLGRYLDWFARQELPVQVGSTLLLFAALFGLGVVTLGLGPLVIGLAVLLEHWYRGT